MKNTQLDQLTNYDYNWCGLTDLLVAYDPAELAAELLDLYFMIADRIASNGDIVGSPKLAASLYALRVTYEAFKDMGCQEEPVKEARPTVDNSAKESIMREIMTSQTLTIESQQRTIDELLKSAGKVEIAAQSAIQRKSE